MRDFRKLLRSERDLFSSGMLRGVEWEYVTDVAGQYIGLIFKRHAVEEGFFMDCLNMAPIGYPETSISYQSTLRNIKEDRRFH
jgi:hypothetical protein